MTEEMEGSTVPSAFVMLTCRGSCRLQRFSGRSGPQCETVPRRRGSLHPAQSDLNLNQAGSMALCQHSTIRPTLGSEKPSDRGNTHRTSRVDGTSKEAAVHLAMQEDPGLSSAGVTAELPSRVKKKKSAQVLDEKAASHL